MINFNAFKRWKKRLVLNPAWPIQTLGKISMLGVWYIGFPLWAAVLRYETRLWYKISLKKTVRVGFFSGVWNWINYGCRPGYQTQLPCKFRNSFDSLKEGEKTWYRFSWSYGSSTAQVVDELATTLKHILMNLKWYYFESIFLQSQQTWSPQSR